MLSKLRDGRVRGCSLLLIDTAKNQANCIIIQNFSSIELVQSIGTSNAGL